MSVWAVAMVSSFRFAGRSWIEVKDPKILHTLFADVELPDYVQHVLGVIVRCPLTNSLAQSALSYQQHPQQQNLVFFNSVCIFLAVVGVS
jgi:hypothetical protein